MTASVVVRGSVVVFLVVDGSVTTYLGRWCLCCHFYCWFVSAVVVTASVVVRGSVVVFLVVDGSVATVFTSVGDAFCSKVVTSTVAGVLVVTASGTTSGVTGCGSNEAGGTVYAFSGGNVSFSVAVSTLVGSSVVTASVTTSEVTGCGSNEAGGTVYASFVGGNVSFCSVAVNSTLVGSSVVTASVTTSG